MADGPEWFAPKRFGYGASYPIAWQGWAVIAVYGAILLLAARFLRDSPLALAGTVVPATAVTMALREPVMRLNNVDFPTLGRPTSTTLGGSEARLRAMQNSS